VKTVAWRLVRIAATMVLGCIAMLARSAVVTENASLLNMTAATLLVKFANVERVAAFEVVNCDAAKIEIFHALVALLQPIMYNNYELI
jgi:hypothetical protein